MNRILRPSVIYSVLGFLTLAQVVTVIYASAAGMSHSAHYNLLTQERAELEERKLVLESVVAQQSALSTIPESIQADFFPIKQSITLHSPNSLALVQ